METQSPEALACIRPIIFYDRTAQRRPDPHRESGLSASVRSATIRCCQLPLDDRRFRSIAIRANVRLGMLAQSRLIDRLGRKLYRLTADEVRIAEEATAR